MRALGAIACVLALAAAGAARAGTQLGTLGADASAAALYQVTCFDDGAGPPASLAVSVRDAAPVAAPQLSVQVLKGGAAANATDDTDGDPSFSSAISIDGGSGVYRVFVDKSAAGAEDFVLSFQCFTGVGGTGVPTGSGIFASPPQVPMMPAFAWWLLVAFLTLCAAPLRGAAHSLNETLGADASATDVIQIVCSDNGSGPPQSLAVDVRDNAPVEVALVSVQLHRGSALVNATDPVDGDTGVSPHVSVDGGAGAYDVLVDKTGAGAESYTLSFHCMTGPGGTGVHTGTASSLVQDH